MYRLTVLKNMRTKVNRTIEIIETVETEVEFPKYTRDDFFYYKHYSEDHCVSVSVSGGYASIAVDYNNKGKHLFDEEIPSDTFKNAFAVAKGKMSSDLINIKGWEE